MNNNDWQNNGKIVKHTVSAKEIEELLERIYELPPDQQMEIGQRLLGGSTGLTVVFGTNNVVANSVSINIGSNEQLNEFIKDLPPDAMAKLLSAISQRVSQYRT